MSSPKPLERIVESREAISKETQLLRAKKAIAIVSVDLAGSTELKMHLDQDAWLPIIASFILTIVKEAEHSNGFVLKYIGDEVLVVFSPQQCANGTVEQFISCCSHSIKELSSQGVHKYQAKFAVDYGEVAEVELPNGNLDYLGTAMDRCSRVGKLTRPGIALSTQSFVEKSDKSLWKQISSCKLKGVKERVHIWQVRNLGKELLKGTTLSLEENQSADMAELKDQLTLYAAEIARLRLRNRG